MENNQTKPLISNGPLFINPSKVLWADVEAILDNGETGVEIQFMGNESTNHFYDGDAQYAYSILKAASEEAPNA